MSEPQEYVLENEEGEREVVRVEENPRHNSGRLTQLLSEGYDFAEESQDLDVSVLATIPDVHTSRPMEEVVNVPARNLRNYLREMSRVSSQTPLVITGDYDVSNYVSQSRENMRRAERVRELEGSLEGAALATYSGVASLPIALGRLTGAIHENDDNVLAGVDSMSELSEARPGFQALGNLATFAIPGVGVARGLSGFRLIQGAGVRASQAAGRLGSRLGLRAGANRVQQGLVGALTEEALFTVGSTLPLVYMQQNPELSAEMLLAGGAVGSSLGYFAGPYFRATRRAAASSAPSSAYPMNTSQIFGGARANPVTTPMGRFVEDARNPPMHTPTPSATSLRLTQMYGGSLPLFSSAAERAAGAPRSPLLSALRSDVAMSNARRRAEAKQYFNNLSGDDIDWYLDERNLRALSIPETTGRAAADGTAEISRDGLVEQTTRHIQDRLDAFDEQLQATGRQGKPGFDIEKGDVYHNILDESRYTAINSSPGADNMFSGVQQNIDRTAEALRSLRDTESGPVQRALDSLIGREGSLVTGTFSRQRNVRGAQDVFPAATKAGSGLTRSQSAQFPAYIRRTMEENHTNLYRLWQRLGQSDVSSIPQVTELRTYVGDILGGRRSARDLASMSPLPSNATRQEGPDVLSGPIFGRQAADRFNRVSSGYSANHPGGAVSEIRRILEDPNTGKVTKKNVRLMFEEVNENAADRRETIVFSALDDLETHARQLAGYSEVSYRPGVPGSPSRTTVSGKTDLRTLPTDMQAVDAARESYAILRRHQDLTAKSEGKNPSSLVGIALAQVGGGLAGAATGPVGGWTVGGALLANSLSERAMNQNPAFQLLQRGRVRQQFIDSQRRMQRGRRNLRNTLRSRLRVAKRLKSAVRLTPARLGFTYFEDKSKKERIEAYNELREGIRAMQSDPMSMVDQVNVSYSPMESINASVAHQMRQVSMRAVSHLASTITPPVTDPLSLANVALPPSMAELDEFGLRLRMVQDPLSIYDDVARGVVAVETVETGNAVFPVLMANLKADVGEAIMELGEDSAHIPYQMRVALATLTGSATDATLESSFIAAMNSRSAQTPQQASAQGLDRMRTRNIDVASGFVTAGQSLEEVV